ncbi:Gfo/Idh/MocA family protein [Enterovibrio paralichthyis]|uniref:Gfo/Idh/MocA family protein n=1 Tax=Enterovibrio paralichthyis TaxID=2853805 RepID=UPI001C466F91|nr:Gfo/Idh/MocA family oxidoreductase [Enterovibrio paralichthyis]MBV7298349.1 Gfo/Idh/MocA family oxidoreductase [Enterovibrio paralichthyis]
MTKAVLNIGLVGSGFMGRCHANAFRSVGGLFDLPFDIHLHTLADVDDETATLQAQKLGFAHSTGSWETLVDNPEIDVVAITAPNALHEAITLAAIKAGKHVYCEKPLSTTCDSAKRMTEAAEQAGTTTLVGFNFLRNPLIHYAKSLIESGDIGDVISFRGRHAEDYMGNSESPHSFRTDPDGGGALADIGSHIVSMARFLVGPITNVNAVTETVHKERPVKPGSSEKRPVLVDDVAHALLEFGNGATGSIDVSWMMTGRTMDLSFEITGTQGAIQFSQERMNELLVWTRQGGDGNGGFRKIETGPAHPPYGNFCPAPGHHLGFNDLKVIEVAELMECIEQGKPHYTGFREGYEVQCTIDAMLASAKQNQWIDVNRFIQ